MLKGFTFTLGALAALALVFVVLFFIGASLPESRETKQRAAEEVMAGYETAFNQLTAQLQNTSSYQARIRLRPGYETLYANWAVDREKCAEVVAHERIYKIDEQLAELEKLTRP